MVDAIATIRKAVVAALVAALVTWLARVGVDVDAGVRDALVTVINAAASGLLVWLVPNKAQG